MMHYIPPVLYSEEACSALTEVIYQTQKRTVEVQGFQTENPQSRGYVESVVHSVFMPPFMSRKDVEERYEDYYEQISVFAYHLSTRHAFSDANKRTTVKAILSLLYIRGIDTTFSDDMSDNNELYIWIRDVVERRRTYQELAQVLRDHAHEHTPHE